MAFKFIAAPAFAAIVGVLACTAPAHARDVKILLSPAEAMAQPAVKRVLAENIAVRFGPASSATANGVEVSASTSARRSSVAQGQSLDRVPSFDDKAFCMQAFVTSLSDLLKEARQQHANTVVDIVSFYEDAEPPQDPSLLECHVGSFRATLGLKGRALTTTAVAP